MNMYMFRFPLVSVAAISYDAQHTKINVIKFADNAGPDQPAQMRRLIRFSVARLQNQRILKYITLNRECPDQTAWMRMLI